MVTVPWPRNERGALAGLKTTSYGENVRALAYAAERGGSEAIFANTPGNLCEGTGSNVFVVTGGELRHPAAAAGCLAGVTRALVIEWAAASSEDVPRPSWPLLTRRSCLDDQGCPADQGGRRGRAARGAGPGHPRRRVAFAARAALSPDP